jgi:hypothetical protein
MLTLIASIENADQLEPLPNIDFNIYTGNALIGLLKVEEAEYNQLDLSEKPYHEIVAEKDHLIRTYRETSLDSKNLQNLRNNIESHRTEANTTLNKVLLSQAYKGSVGRSTHSEQTTIEDIKALKPFHWGYEFDKVLNENGGFDVIITTPPWEIIRPQNLQQNLFLQLAKQYKYQTSDVDRKRVVSYLNSYKLFIEQSYNLLRPGGQCGLIIPSGIYSDLSAKQLRELLFEKTRITGLFSFENRKSILKGVHRDFKFVLLTFEKGKRTERFPATFNRYDVEELEYFPEEGSVAISVNLIRRLSPASLSIAEFKNETDIRISEKMLRFPLLGEKIDRTWNVEFTRGVMIATHRNLLHSTPEPELLPLYEGKMIHQFTHTFAPPRYWVNKRETFIRSPIERNLNYREYCLGCRSITSSTNERTLIAAILPPNVVIGDTMYITRNNLDAQELLFLTAILNSFLVDFFLRLQASRQIATFNLYQLPIPRLTKEDMLFFPIVERSARLTCITDAFKDLWNRALPDSWSPTAAATTFGERTRLRAELDGLIAHLYNVTEEELAYVLKTFPLVAEPVKLAVRNAYRDVERGLVK